MVTMTDIAKMVGVSQATVSRVINGNTSVDMETQRKVNECIRKLNYQPNATAQTLARRQSFLLGIVLPDFSNPFFSDILSEIESDAAKNGYSILFCNSKGNPQLEKMHINALRSRQVDGIFIIPVKGKTKEMADLKELNIPIVVITQNIEGFDSVLVSHYRGGEQMAKHFVGMGYRKIGFIGKREDEKFLGFQKVLKDFGIEIMEKYIIDCDTWNQLTSHEISNKLKKILDSREKPDVEAIFAYNDIAAFAAIRVFEDYGYEIPGDIAVAGFDNTFISYETRPELTTVAQPISEIGRIAMEIMLGKIEKNEPEEIKEIVLEPQLIVRETTKKYK